MCPSYLAQTFACICDLPTGNEASTDIRCTAISTDVTSVTPPPTPPPMPPAAPPAPPLAALAAAAAAELVATAAPGEG